MGKRMAIFASGGGSNARRLMQQGCRSNFYEVALVLSDQPTSGVQSHASEFAIPFVVVQWKETSTSDLVALLKEYKIDFIVLAGFLRLVPKELIDVFYQRIINLHPSLLPKYGGKGMYGRHVHRAVFNAKESQTGITIHYVSEEYDKGAVIAQFVTEILPEDTVETIEDKVRQLEAEHFVEAIEDTIKSEIPYEK
ncbi:MAG: phosphoribosylglycinamide formyltransferase [Bacteroidota bacterium]|nr:phosphoribosylglycinamide formyltransferase [Bacteroidota bacterium]